MALRASTSAVVRAPRAAQRFAPVAAPRSVVVRPRDVRMAAAQPADQSSSDFDAILNTLAQKWETVPSDKKPIVGGYLAGAVTAVFFTEWLIHLPALDVLLGWPIQLLGVFALPWLAVRWFLGSKVEPVKDLEGAVNDIANQLPGLKK